jgi:hypothetical protein
MSVSVPPRDFSFPEPGSRRYLFANLLITTFKCPWNEGLYKEYLAHRATLPPGSYKDNRYQRMYSFLKTKPLQLLRDAAKFAPSCSDRTYWCPGVINGGSCYCDDYLWCESYIYCSTIISEAFQKYLKRIGLPDDRATLEIMREFIESDECPEEPDYINSKEEQDGWAYEKDPKHFLFYTICEKEGRAYTVDYFKQYLKHREATRDYPQKPGENRYTRMQAYIRTLPLIW